MNKPWPTVRLGEVLRPVPRPVNVRAEDLYREIGIRSHGKGVFHKPPISGLELGSKKVFWVEPGDFVLNIVFAWEGAVGVLTEAEKGMIGSHRFPTFRADENRLDARFLLHFFKTPLGVEMLGRVSPGGAGRNRTLSRTRFLQIVIPLPPLSEQRRVVERIQALASQIHEARTLRQDAAEEAEALLSRAGSATLCSTAAEAIRIDDLVGADGLRNGRSVKSIGVDSEVKCLTLSSMRNGLINTKDAKPVPMSRTEAGPFRIRRKDVYVVRGNGSKDLCGRAGLVTEETDGVVFPDLFIRINLPTERILPEFFVSAWNSSKVRSIIEEKAKTTSGIWKINQGHILSISVPIPPLPEQRRIVAEMDALQAEVDSLKRLQSETAEELDARKRHVRHRRIMGGAIDVVGVGYGIYETGSGDSEERHPGPGAVQR